MGIEPHMHTDNPLGVAFTVVLILMLFFAYMWYSAVPGPWWLFTLILFVVFVLLLFAILNGR